MSPKIFAVILVIVVLLGTGFFWLASVKKPTITQNSKSKVLPTPVPAKTEKPVSQTILMFGNLSALSSSKTYSLPIIIQAEKNAVTGIQIELNYDPQAITSVNIAPGSFFTNPVILFKTIDIVNGRVSYAIGINPQNQGIKKKEGIAAILSFKASSPISQTTAISFLENSLVTTEEIDGSILNSTIPTQFVLGQN